METRHILSICILAGGKSSRMGSSKPRLHFLGEPLIQRILKRIHSLSADIFISANDPEEAAFLGVPIIPDRLPGQGPLGGLLNALEYSCKPYVIVLACDMPFVNQYLLKAELELCQNNGADAVMPETYKGLEPLHAVYHRESCIPLVRESLASGGKRMICWMDSGKVRRMTREEVIIHDPACISFWNINTPGDLAVAERVALALGEGGGNESQSPRNVIA